MNVIVGCSYTEPKHNIWIDHIFGTDHVNLGHPGASNTHIYLKIVAYVLEHGNPGYVFVQATGLHRISVILSQSHMSNFNNFNATSSPYPGVKSLELTGPMGSWNETYPEKYRQIAKEMFWPLDEEYLSIQGLFPLLSLFSFLQNRSIKFNWTTMYDYTKPQVGMHDNHSFGSVSADDMLYNSLPWNKFVGPTPYEFALERNGFRDGVHLDDETQIAWANEIKGKIQR